MNATILSTSLLPSRLIYMAEQQGILIDAQEFININNNTDLHLAAEVKQMSALPITAIFTSVNAVKAVNTLLNNRLGEWTIYCIGNATKKAVALHFGVETIKGTAPDAASLAQIIVNDGEKNIVFFCGNKRMGILPDVLSKNNIAFRELVVYQMTETPKTVYKAYNGILFYSPSGVQSFFSVNTANPACVMFAIGHTTARALSDICKNELIICANPSKEQMINDAIKYFDNKTLASTI